MNLLNHGNVVEKLHMLLVQRKTGTSKTLAGRLEIDLVTLHLLLEELNALNMPVSYSKKYETFYYERDVKSATLLKVC